MCREDWLYTGGCVSSFVYVCVNDKQKIQLFKFFLKIKN